MDGVYVIHTYVTRNRRLAVNKKQGARYMSDKAT